jgi:hypothetical protein
MPEDEFKDSLRNDGDADSVQGDPYQNSIDPSRWDDPDFLPSEPPSPELSPNFPENPENPHI